MLEAPAHTVVLAQQSAVAGCYRDVNEMSPRRSRMLGAALGVPAQEQCPCSFISVPSPNLLPLHQVVFPKRPQWNNLIPIS